MLSKVPDTDASPSTALLDLPHDPEASDGHLDLRELLGQGQKGNPVPIPHKTLHQATDLNSLLRRRGWHNQGESGTLWSKSIILRKKERPDLIPLQVWFSRPTKDSNSFCRQALRSPHASN